MNRSIFILWAIISSIVPLSATDYYVGPLGSDSSNGSSSNPFKTLKKAASVLKAGDICHIMSGIYRETLKPATSGTESSPITFLADQGEDVLISACDISENWSNYKEDVYSTDWSDTVTQLFIDGIPANQARFPNGGTDLFSPATFEVSMDQTLAQSKALNHTQDFWKGGVIWAMLGHRWVAQVAKIAASEPGKLTLSANTWTDNNGEGIAYITGVKSALDTAGEWHYENKKLYLQLSPSDRPVNHKIEIKTRKWVIDLSSKKHIRIKNIATFGGAIDMNQSTYCTLDNLVLKYLSHFVDIKSGGSSWLRHDWTNITYDGIGIGIFGSNNCVKNSEIAWSAGDGVTLYGSDNLIDNCTIHDCNYSGADCNPVTAHGAGHVITRSTIYNGGRGLIGFSFTQSVIIKYNHCYKASLMNWDVGGIFSFGTSAKGAVVAYNWVHDIISGGDYKLGNGIYIDNFCSDITVHHNVIWNCSYNAYNYSRPAKNIFFFNNTAFNAPDVNYSYIPDTCTDTSSGNKMYNNLTSFSFGDFNALTKLNNLSISPLPLLDITNYDFRVSDDASQVIDKGLIIESITDGFTGDAPDIGAYENGGIFWKAGAGTSDTVPLFAKISEKIKKQVKLNYSFKFYKSHIFFRVFRSFSGSLELLTAQGQIAETVYQGKFPEGMCTFPIRSEYLAQGMYLVVLYNKQKKSYSYLSKITISPEF